MVQKNNNSNITEGKEAQYQGIKGNDADNGFVFDWHDSIPLEALAALIPSDSSCLMVGCGNSLLPQVVLDRKATIPLTLLDTSQTCLDQLKLQYSSYSTKEVSYVCGSATKMSNYFGVNDAAKTTTASFCDSKTSSSPPPPPPAITTYFDVILDKGLVDAFMCGEGWEGPVEALLRESSRVVDPQRGGTYILVSYKMAPAIQEVFQEMCDKVVADGDDQQLVWKWDFDMDTLSNDRVSLSIATIRPKSCR